MSTKLFLICYMAVNEFIVKVRKNVKVSIEELKAGGRRREVSRVRARIAIGLVETYQISLAEIARQLGATTGQRLADLLE